MALKKGDPITKYLVRFSILTISGRSREIMEKEVNMQGIHSPYLVKRVKEHIRRMWVHSKPRVLKIKKLKEYKAS